ncbi:MAG: 30S ribosomal protein S4 [Spirochaetales bacterium]|nr:30S ribosomal protein S4 [Spirochaetales bacterium]
MARYTGPQCRLCRAEGSKLFLKGERCFSDHCSVTKKRPAPGKGLRSRQGKRSDYGLQLREKQKMKRIYCMLEKQFKITFQKAARMPGRTGDSFISLLEKRLDNVIYRLRFAASRKQARQLVSHGHILVNGKRVNIPSYQLKIGDKVELGEKAKKLLFVKESMKEYTRSGVAPWLEVNPDELVGYFRAIPRRNDVADLADIKEQLVVEFYSK